MSRAIIGETTVGLASDRIPLIDYIFPGFDLLACCRNLPDDPDDRVGENAKDGVKKYYLYDDDAAIDQATEV